MTKIHAVVAFDFTGSAEAALARALDQAARTPQLVLHIVAVIPPEQGLAIWPIDAITPDYVGEIQRLVRQRVYAALRRCPLPAANPVQMYARVGDPSREILQLADETGADTVFIGTRGTNGFERRVLGSVSERVVRDAGCTVVVVRNHPSRARSTSHPAPTPHN